MQSPNGSRAEHFRDQAEVLRSEAELEANVAVQKHMLHVADQLDQLADAIDLQSVEEAAEIVS